MSLCELELSIYEVPSLLTTFAREFASDKLICNILFKASYYLYDMPSFTGYTPYTKKEENRDRGDDSVFGTDSEDEAEDIFEGADFDFSIKKPARQLRQVVQEMKELQRKDGSFFEKPGVARVRGKFDPLFSEPWWRVELQVNTVKSSKHEKMGSSLPSYMYRTDDGVGKDILSLFLQACEVHQQNVTMFLEFIRNNDLRPSLNSLLENLNQFSNSSEDHEEVAHQIQTSLHHTRKFNFNKLSAWK